MTPTPAPWTMEDRLNQRDFIGIYANNVYVCELRDPVDGVEAERMRVNAAHIVHCVNSHDVLVTALRLAADTVATAFEYECQRNNDQETINHYDKVMQQINDALTIAEKGA